MLDSKKVLLERGKDYGDGKDLAKKVILAFNLFRNQDLEIKDFI